MQTKELLSQDEIRALLEISPAAIPESPESVQSSAPDAVLANAAEELLHYLQRSGLQAGSYGVTQKGTIGMHRCKSFRRQGTVIHLCIENSLANAFIESLLGGKSSRFEDDRAPGSLDEAFLALLFRETQKLLQPHLQKVKGFGSCRQVYFLEFFLGNTKSVMKLVLEGVAPAGAEKQVKTDMQKIKVEAVLGVDSCRCSETGPKL